MQSLDEINSLESKEKPLVHSANSNLLVRRNLLEKCEKYAWRSKEDSLYTENKNGSAVTESYDASKEESKQNTNQDNHSDF